MTQDKPDNKCPFCRIRDGKLPVSMIHEDELVMIIVDLNPINEGHLLIIPKVHSPEMAGVAPDTLAYMMRMAQRMNKALRKSSYRCEGVNLFMADGEAAGQEVFPCHLHVYPRFKGDGFGFRHVKGQHFIRTDRERMDAIALELRELL
ncbi:HIT family protein [Neolewinella aurantiaca]|uniref:HIT family protein n=1 Tax=Neolewinella aurantiaca TaxID=2602767 RepID=A0A5C7FQK3_9BACT|nr:HIT family protein [Neolewinella aurantiaca]TXF90105.1 HIT family protein [Neolewinella aurantiaca]